nr:MAG TPA: hypothetical protein [Caudoviricetes sp.]DAU94669.1 MAG TPA: hypothetical protein [Caudoviricetes sp.]
MSCYLTNPRGCDSTPEASPNIAPNRGECKG